MKKTWKSEDIIDLNFFYEQDQQLDEEMEQELFARDRDIFLEVFHNRSGDSPGHIELLALWLDNRKQTGSNADGATRYPGKTITEYISIFRLILISVGMILGIFGGLSFFVYTGSTPLNVFSYISIFIIPQLLLIVLFLFRFLLTGAYKRSSVNINHFVKYLFSTLIKLIGRNFASDIQSTPKQMLSLLRDGVLFWPLFIAAQLFGIAFNIGLAGTTLYKIATTDLAFGWQTTLQLGSQKIDAFVQFVASPWSWFLPVEIARPTLEQISGSRIILKDGIYNMLTDDLTSWWPFLLMCLLFYGLLPRTLLFLYGLFIESRANRRYAEKFRFREITRRMASPNLSSQATQPDTQPPSNWPKPRPKRPAPSFDRKSKDAIVLIPDDITHESAGHDIEKILEKTGFMPIETRTIFESYDTDAALTEELKNSRKPVVVLLESWMPPIEEQLLFLKSLEDSQPGNTSIAVLLLGRQDTAGNFAQPREADAELWQKALQKRCENVYILPKHT